MISIVVAVSNNNVIGFGNKLPWKLLPDQLMFKQLTLNHTVIMGRKTFESIKSKLEGRKIIILTKQKKYKKDDILIANSVKEALNLANKDKEIFIIGGEQIYKKFLNFADKVYLTKIYKDFIGDKYFPKLDQSKWNIKNQSEITKDPKSGLDYQTIIYNKNKV